MSQTPAPKFYPPRNDAISHRLVAFGMPLVRRYWARVDKVLLPSDDAARLRAAFARPGIVCPNHPSLAEPTAVWDVIDRLGLRAQYVMDRRVLRMTGLLRPILQGAGAYSLRRGTADRESFACTRRLLVEGRQIVMFPEGETYGVNDALLPFHEGVAQMAFWGRGDRLKAHLDGEVLLVPVAVKYIYQPDMRATIEAVLARLEDQVGLTVDRSLGRYQRLRRLGLAALANMEQSMGLPGGGDLSLDERLDRWYTNALAKLSRTSEVELPTDGTLQDRLRRLFGVVEERLYEPKAPSTPHQRALEQQREPAWRAFESDLCRLQCFQAVRDGYVAAHPSAERYLDVLGRLDREISGRVRCYARRDAHVRVGEPVALSDWADDYAADKRGCVVRVTQALRERVRRLVAQLTELAPPLTDEPRPEPPGAA
ncbi:MAG: 1-acyl-sn-glycerol-3-phosphate acyltransferase [Armatimonadetes bacterium]|nr:1-acyl-sn-glycerol-3-phosphate acyltransferase [Armatimonadota bacterium]